MQVVVQRVTSASVAISGEIVGQIDRGMLILVGIGSDDDDSVLQWMADKVAHLRIFPDDAGRMNRSIVDVAGQVLSVSQFTLLADTRKGTRPGFSAAAHPDVAEPAWEQFNELLRSSGLDVQTGRFAADMQVSLVNDGPVTLLLNR